MANTERLGTSYVAVSLLPVISSTTFPASKVSTSAIIIIEIAAGITSLIASTDVAILFNCPKSINLGNDDNPPVNVPGGATDSNVARGSFNIIPKPVATTRPTKEDGTALVTRGNN